MLPQPSAATCGSESSIAARFEQQVDAHADRLAIKHLDREMTYRQLDRAANRIAHALLALRGDDEEPVVILTEPGPAAIVMLLGVLKSGKFYVPLDPSHPRRRLRDIVTDVDPRLMLTTSTHEALAKDLAMGRSLVVNVDRVDATTDTSPALAIAASRLAFMFYTSGTTGRPKGVLQTQGNVLHHIGCYADGLRLSPADRITMLHSHAFSASRLDIFGALLNGASVFPLSVTETGLSVLARRLADERLTVSHWVPTLFRYFVRALDDEHRFPQMRAVVLGSEAVLPGDVALFNRPHFHDACVLVNRFGATETGNISWLFLDKHATVPGDVVPVGFPIGGAEVLLLDERRSRVGPGTIGQIAVRSAYLSPGYWKNAELTRSVFLPDPEGGDRRVYLTGDLGRLRPDGALEHLGRRDAQTKVRGFRVETAEIEAALSTHPDIQEAVVDAVTGENGETQLAAHMVPIGGRSLRGEDVRTWLASVLPAYMVPAIVVVAERLPRTATGKIDRTALSAVHRDHEPPPGSTVSSDPLERSLARMCADVLGLIAVAATDNFFAIGGNSLLAAQLMVRIHRSFGQELPPAALFRAPTVKQLAELLRRSPIEVAPWHSLVPIQPLGSRTPFFWIHGDRSNAYLADYVGTDQPVYGVMHQSLDGRPAAYTRVETLAAHYLRQVRAIQPEGPYLLGGYSFGGTVAFEMARRLTREGQHVALLVLLDSLFPGSPTTVAVLEQSPSSSGLMTYAEHTLSHFEKLAHMSLGDRLAYVRVRLTNRANAIISRSLDVSIKRLVCRVCLRMNWTLPVFVRTHYILSVYHEAIRHYRPDVFSGRAVYFKSASRSGAHQEAWNRVVAGGLDVHEVPGDHSFVIQRENAAPWARQLQRCLEQVQQQDSCVIVGRPCS